jgi:hypothetical protein
MGEVEDTIGRVVGREHRRLDALFAEVLDALGERQERGLLRSSFARLREAIETHLAQEDQLYYPALRALQPAHRTTLRGFAEAHDGFRFQLAALEAALADAELAEVERRLGVVAADFARHESGEETLLNQIDAEVLAARSRVETVGPCS